MLQIYNKYGQLKVVSSTSSTGVSSVSGVSPITSTGGTNPIISTLVTPNKLLGRHSASTGSMQEIIIGSGLSLVGNTLVSSVTPNALTKVDDTNVTLTLGGTPSTALLQNVSLTLGWTGTLADSRITSASTWNAKQDAISLTTLGTSGPATFISNVLNIPQYTDTYTGTVTSVAALTLGTAGTDLSSTVANGTTTPVITLNVPTASATNRGALSSADWTMFNNKQNALTNPITGTGANGQVAFFNGTNSQTGDNDLFWNNTNKRLGIGTNSPSERLDVNGGARFQSNLTIGLTTNNAGSRTVFNNSTTGRSFQIANNWNIGNSFEITPSTTVAGSIFTTPALVVNGTTSNVGIGTTSPQSRLDVRAQGALSTDIAFRVRNSADTANLISVDGIGQTIITPTALTGTSATSALDIAQTWNTTGTPTAIRLNVTNTASNAGSLLMDLRVGGVSQFNVSRSGIASCATSLNAPVINVSTINGWADTSGTVNLLRIAGNIVPSSGNANFNTQIINPTINQTGGANGITRGLFINPTLTSAFDFRAIEVTGGKLVFSSTITPIGTTGAQTINRISGKINAAAGTTSLVVTNSLVTTSSIVMCQLGTNDATCAVRSVVEANGSFTINYTAPTAETVIKFTVIN